MLLPVHPLMVVEKPQCMKELVDDQRYRPGIKSATTKPCVTLPWVIWLNTCPVYHNSAIRKRTNGGVGPSEATTPDIQNVRQ